MNTDGALSRARPRLLEAAHLLTPSRLLLPSHVSDCRSHWLQAGCTTSPESVARSSQLTQNVWNNILFPKAPTPNTAPNSIPLQLSFQLSPLSATPRTPTLPPAQLSLKPERANGQESEERREQINPPSGVGLESKGTIFKALLDDSNGFPEYCLSEEGYEDMEVPVYPEGFSESPKQAMEQSEELRERKRDLISAVCCSLIDGPDFSRTEDPSRLRLQGICQDIAGHDPEFILKVALYTRQELNVRSTANFLLALGAWLPQCRPHVRRYFSRSVRLPSDWLQVAKLYQSLCQMETRRLAPFPNCLRRSLADKFKEFDEYQLAKYNSRSQRSKRVPVRARQRRSAPSPADLTLWSRLLNRKKSLVQKL
ncbi:telomerase protein component 1, partial [Callorhinchus milii]|uniref:telomerase protein component 1 n=1 Tax=Callorhinchus milii TaxID=7868 RepID=UPI001C3FDBE8